MPIKNLELNVLNWNIGGAKYLALKKHDDPDRNGQESRENFRHRLNDAIETLINNHDPQVFFMQEFVRYEESGIVSKANNVIDIPEGYKFFPLILIDTDRHSHQGKWTKVRELGGWDRCAYFGQGNAILIRDDVQLYPVWSIPKLSVPPQKWADEKQAIPECDFKDKEKMWIEAVKLETGLYFGDRDTEPRAAMVAHIVLDGSLQERQKIILKKPLDVFFINLHLTTLLGEREGIPDIDKAAEDTRLRQLDIVLDGIISRYNSWRIDKFPIRGKPGKYDPELETIDRHNPIWVIAGDFNFTRESKEYHTLKRRNFIDLIQDENSMSKASGLGKRPTINVDYVFAGPRFVSIDPYIVMKQSMISSVIFDRAVAVSDHYPIRATIPIELQE